MLALDRDAFICDMAETYRIYDIRSVELPYLAILASGLGMDSRIRRKTYGLKASWPTVMLAMLIDGLSKDEKSPLMSNFVEKKSNAVKTKGKVFASIEDFEAAKAAILGGHTNG